MDSFGKRLRHARELRGLTQREIAEFFGIKRPNISKWEADEYMPEAEKLPALCELLGVSADWLQAGKGDTPSLNGGGRSLVDEATDLFRQLPEDDMLRELAWLRQRVAAASA